MSAVLSHEAALGVLKPGEHGSTFGGNPLACAVARMALKVLVEEGMIENAANMGARMQEGLRQTVFANSGRRVREVRGRGLMLAVELEPDGLGARPVCEDLRRRGILCKETHAHTIRIAPPLVITADEVDWAVEQFAASLA